MNITAGNVVGVSDSLNDLVISTNETADQNTDNIGVVSAILNQTANLLSKNNTMLSSKEVLMVKRYDHTCTQE